MITFYCSRLVAKDNAPISDTVKIHEGENVDSNRIQVDFKIAKTH